MLLLSALFHNFHIVYTSLLQLPPCAFFPNINTNNLPRNNYKLTYIQTKWGTKNIYQITCPPTGVISDSEGASAPGDALSCKSKSVASLTYAEDVAFLAKKKNVSILCVVFLILDIVSFFTFLF